MSMSRVWAVLMTAAAQQRAANLPNTPRFLQIDCPWLSISPQIRVHVSYSPSCTRRIASHRNMHPTHTLPAVTKAL
jgi:hypothetical protein